MTHIYFCSEDFVLLGYDATSRGTRIHNFMFCWPWISI